MNDTVHDDTRSTVSDRRRDLGKLFAVLAVTLAAITPIPGFLVVGSTEFAQDFTSGTHTADLTGLYASGWMALGTGLCAVLAALVGRGGARATGIVVLCAPAIGLLLLR